MTPSDAGALRQQRRSHPRAGFFIKPAVQQPMKFPILHNRSNRTAFAQNSAFMRPIGKIQSPQPGRPLHGGRTWVTLEGIDMGNRIGKNVVFFRGHVLGNHYFDLSANSSCETAVQGPSTHGPSVPSFWDQSENGLQVEATLLEHGRVRNTYRSRCAPRYCSCSGRVLACGSP